MKQHYKKYDGSEFPKWKGIYSLQYYYWRAGQNFNERRQNAGAIADGYKVRGKRRQLRHTWDDVRVSRGSGRSWKDYTKRKKQWKFPNE